MICVVGILFRLSFADKNVGLFAYLYFFEEKKSKKPILFCSPSV